MIRFYHLFLITVFGMAVSYSTFSQDDSVLSSTGLYSDIGQFTIAPDVREYSVQYPLYTDGLQKRRWVLIPSGSQINTADANWWDFPEGTKLWKEFSFNADGKFKRIETRLIQKINGTWIFTTYLWNHLDTEAIKSSGQMLPNYADLGEGVFHNIPSERNCKTCHFARDGSAPILGFSALQLDHQDKGLNLNVLKNEKLLTHALPDDIAIKSPTLEGARAQGLLHGNCSHCHNAKGTMGRIDMDLRHDVFNKTIEGQNAFKTTVNKESFFQFPDTEVSSKRILPGQPDASVLFRRVKASNHLDPDFDLKMPPGSLGTMTQNKELLKNLESWIRSIASQN